VPTASSSPKAQVSQQPQQTPALLFRARNLFFYSRKMFPQNSQLLVPCQSPNSRIIKKTRRSHSFCERHTSHPGIRLETKRTAPICSLTSLTSFPKFPYPHLPRSATILVLSKSLTCDKLDFHVRARNHSPYVGDYDSEKSKRSAVQ